MNEMLAYSIHLGNDKNKTKKAKEIAKNNQSNTTSFSNNSIQNLAQLSKANNHNLRKYNNKTEQISVIYGTNNLINDVQNLYLQEFENARIEYNNKQTREDRKIQNYFEHISKNSNRDLCCELIIELGDMKFWQDKTQEYCYKMVQVYKEQVSSIKDYISNVEDTTKSMKKVNDLDIIIKEYEKDLKEHHNEVRELNSTIRQKDEEIRDLSKDLDIAKNTISKQQKEINVLKPFKILWNRLMKFIKNKVTHSKSETYKKVYQELKIDNILRQEDIDFIDNKNTKKRSYEL